MLNHPTLDKLRTMRLTGMADAFIGQLEKPPMDLDFESRFGFLVEQEWLLRENRKLNRLLKTAKFKEKGCVEDIDYQRPRSLNKSKVLEIAQGGWVNKRLNLFITGPTGCGKTYLACAFGHKACLQGFSSQYHRMPRLWHELKKVKAAGSYLDWLSKTSKINVLVLDDWGIDTLEDEQRRDLLEILDDRYQQSSTIITSQLPISHWHAYLNDATLADAILDRVLHNGIKLELTLDGDSLRKTKKPLQGDKL